MPKPRFVLPAWAVPLGGLVLGLGLLAWASSRASLPRADFTFINGTEVQSLDPSTVTGIPEGRILRALFEGLTIKDPETLEPLPGVAERWEISADGRHYTFHLRENARWSNGDPVTAEDFVYSWRRLLDPRTAAEYAYQLWYVVGAREYTTVVGSDGAPQRSFDSVGIRALDPSTLAVELVAPTPFFLELCAFYALLPIHPGSLEAAPERFGEDWATRWLAPENLVGNGPYRLTLRRLNERLRLTKSASYWAKDQIAFETIDVLPVESYLTNLNLYLQGDADWINYIPNQLIPRLLPREDFDPAPYFGSYFYRVNVDRPPFDDLRVRRALALAIDRRAIVERITKSGQRPWASLTPYGTLGYTSPAMPCRALENPDYDAGFAEDLSEARQLLVAAGFGPGGNPFPTFEIHYNTSETHRDIAEVIADGWRRELGVPAKLENQEWKVYLATQSNQEYWVSRSAWIGDYVDPLTFLDLFVTDGENNKTGWSDPEYDRLIAAASTEGDPALRVELFRQAETRLLAALPILPIYSYSTQNIVAPRLGGFPANLLDELQLRWLYWRDDRELAAWREQRPGDPSGQALVAPHGPPEGQYPPCAPQGRFPVGDPRQRLAPQVER